MKPTPQNLLELIQNKENPLIPVDAGAVFPNYEGASLINLPASICHWLGIGRFGAQPLAPQWLSALPGRYDRVVMLLVDGLGYDLLTRLVTGGFPGISGLEIWSELAAKNPPLPLTSVSPSTTAAALTSFWTACPPLQHGMLAYELWLKEYGILANMITFSAATARSETGGLRRSGFDPKRFMVQPTFADHLRSQGVTPLVMQHTSIARTDLSQMLTESADVLSFRAGSDLWLSLAERLSNPSPRKQFIYVYWGILDELMHFFGPADERVLLELAAFTMQMRHFLEKVDQRLSNTLLLLTADHGQHHTPKRAEFDLGNHPQLTACLTMAPTGESRLPFLYVHPRQEDRLRAYVETTWAGAFPMLPSDAVAESGLLGSVPAGHTHRQRLADWVVFPRQEAYWWWANRENVFLGRHGGLSREEMLIPLMPIIQ